MLGIKMKNAIAPAPVDFAGSTKYDSDSGVVQHVAAIVFCGAYFSLSVIGIGSIVFGCADLVAGFVAFSFQWSMAYLLTYVWAGFLFGVANGAVALKAAYLKSQMSANWRSAIFGLSIVTLALHTIDFVTVATSVAMLASYYSGVEREVSREEQLFEYPGANDKGIRPFNITICNYYYYQTPLVAEAPRFVCVCVLVAMDIWMIFVTSKLRSCFNQKSSPKHAAAVIFAHFASDNVSAVLARQSKQAAEPSSFVLSFQLQRVAGSQSQRRDTLDLQRTNNNITEIELLSKAKVAFTAAGLGSIVFGIGQSIAAVLTAVTWLAFHKEFSWLNRGFAGVAFVLAIANGSVVLRSASSDFRMKSHCSNLAICGLCSLVAYLLTASFCVYNLAIVGEAGPTFYRSDSQSLAGTFSRVVNRVYVRIVTPAVPEAARLVILFVLVTLTTIQLYFARKLEKHVRMKRASAQVSYLDQSSSVSSYPTIVLPMSASYSSQKQQKRNTIFMFDTRAPYSAPTCPGGIQSVTNDPVSCCALPTTDSVFASLPYVDS